ncbi:GNAT family N-acetyltransferase [Lampropedia puyangensis]|uniref:GNAT family N-acetyltransferase n=1 Tax=Lampropedia puyangensis TaxID=1330072 RepID=A0A4S8F7X0_9BURK|nr:GNAT family N-acetyltransferase [Lampropedia puyangensis]THU02765.1 GNAT family N-acetyltransferase [Lampropedia puyangensis]
MHPLPTPSGHSRIIARLHSAISEIDAHAWNTLLAQQKQPTPFMRHEYLLAMEQSQSARPENGWTACHLCLWDAQRLIAACPLYLKSHSWGEYVFDFAWANAYAEHGKAYYPKALVAPPFTPAPGTRLMAQDDTTRTWLLQTLSQWCNEQGLETAHILFLSEQDRQACTQQHWLIRQGVQFHWHNAAPGTDQRFASFTQFLESLQGNKRKKIKQEMRKVADAGIEYRTVQGKAITSADWAFFYRCYERTYLEHGNSPYLSPAFWKDMQHTMPDHWLLFIAQSKGEPIACSLLALHDQSLHGGSENIAYGRYWGALARVNSLHFDLCYYQPIAWCIAHGYDRFEGGAQGEHKLARALLPETTYSAHWIADGPFQAAIGRYLERERKHTQDYAHHLQAHSPLKAMPLTK